MPKSMTVLPQLSALLWSQSSSAGLLALGVVWRPKSLQILGVDDDCLVAVQEAVSQL
jgi:hypothetical protein